MHELDDAFENRRIGLGQYPVPEVEDVPRIAVIAREHITDFVGNDRPWGQRDRGIEIALQSHVVTKGLARVVEMRAPIDTDDIGARIAHQGEELSGMHAEMNG